MESIEGIAKIKIAFPLYVWGDRTMASMAVRAKILLQKSILSLSLSLSPSLHLLGNVFENRLSIYEEFGRETQMDCSVV